MSRSINTKRLPGQLQFDDAEPTAEEETAPVVAETTETITYTRNKKGTGRKALPKSLPYIQNIHDLSDDDFHRAFMAQRKTRKNLSI